MYRVVLFDNLQFIIPKRRTISFKFLIIKQRNSTSLVNCQIVNGVKKISPLSSLQSQIHRKVFASNLKKKHEQPPDETIKTLRNDEELQKILKDFAKDFGVANETDMILEDHKKSLDKPFQKNSQSSDECFAAGVILNKYTEFSETKTKILPSYEKAVGEKLRLPDVSTKRGVTGVYDIHELIHFLHQENLLDIAVITVPKEWHYVDYLVMATAKSHRHSDAAFENVIKMYKMKKEKKDPFVILEGEKVANWKALDMRNIVLHVFMDETRKYYDMESLWLFDSEYDSGGTLKADPMYGAIEEQIAFFHLLQDSIK